jgi:hypothetical protein
MTQPMASASAAASSGSTSRPFRGAHDLGDARDARGHHRQAHGHGFQQHVGDAVAVAVGGDARRLHVDLGLGIAVDDLLARQLAQQLHGVGEAAFVDLRLQRPCSSP